MTEDRIGSSLLLMAPALMLNPVSQFGGSRDSSSKKKKKRNRRSKDNRQSQNHRGWKSESQQKVYTSKLVQALSRIRLTSPSISSSNEAPRRGRAVREAADRVLAMAAKGRTRWSRAILTNRPKLKFRKQKRKRAPTTVNSHSKKPRVGVWRLKGKTLTAVQRKVKVLGRLVPGCRKEPLPVILEEVTDYIAALEMQVRTMTALAGLLSGDTSGAGSPSPPHHLSSSA